MSFKPELLNFKVMHEVCASVSDIELMLARSKLLLSHWDDLAERELDVSSESRIVFIAPDMRVDLDVGLCSNISIGVREHSGSAPPYRTYRLPECALAPHVLLTIIYDSWVDCYVHEISGRKVLSYPVGGSAEYEELSNRFTNPKRKQLLEYVITYLELYLQWLKQPFDCAKYLDTICLGDSLVVQVITSIRDRGQLLLNAWDDLALGNIELVDKVISPDGKHVHIGKGLCYNLRSTLREDKHRGGYLSCYVAGVDLDNVLYALYTQWYGTAVTFYPVGGSEEYEKYDVNKFANPRRKELCEYVVDSMNLCLEYLDDRQNAK